MKTFTVNKLLLTGMAAAAGAILNCASVKAETLIPLSIPALNIPSCSGTCYALSIQTSPGGAGIAPSTELKFGFSFDLDRSERDRLAATATKVQAERKSASQQFIAGLERELTDAIAQQRYERARILAIQLAPRLGYKDYRLYLLKISAGSFPNP
jgi:hypothetical protein